MKSRPGGPNLATLLTGLLVLDLLLATCWPNLVGSCAATGLFVLFLVTMFAADPAATWLLFPFILLQSSVLLSLNVIDAGAYMLEMGQYGKPTAAAPLYACYSVVLLSTSIHVYRALRTRAHPDAGPDTVDAPGMQLILQWSMVWFGVGCAGYLLLAGLKTGFPLLTGTDRFEFRRLFADMATVNILNLKTVLACALGTVAALTRRSGIKSAAYGSFAALMGLSFLYGDKFFTILTSTGVFIAPRLVKRPESAGRMLLKVAPFAALIMVSAIAVTVLIYSNSGTRSMADTLRRLGDRVAGQGQLWQMAVEHSPGWINVDASMLRENLNSILARNSQDFVFEHHLGAEYFVYRYSPTAMYKSFVHNAGFVTPTMGYEAYGLVMFGYAGLIVLMVGTGTFLGWLLSYLHRTITRGDLFAVLLPAFILTQAGKVLAQGTLYNLLSVSTCKWYAALLLLQVLARAMARGLSPNTVESGRMESSDHAARRTPLLRQ